MSSAFDGAGAQFLVLAEAFARRSEQGQQFDGERVEEQQAMLVRSVGP